MSDIPSELVIRLDPPIKHAGGEIAELRLKEPLAVQVATADKETMRGYSQDAVRRRDLELVGFVTGVPVEALRKLPVSITRQATDFVNAFGKADPAKAMEPGDHPPSWTMTIDPPVKIGPVTYATLELSEPVAGDVETAERELKSTTAAYYIRQYQLRLVSLNAGIPTAVVGKLRIRELDVASHYLQGFITGGQETGEA